MRPQGFSAFYTGMLLLAAVGLNACGGDTTSVKVNTSGDCAVRGDTVGLHLYQRQLVSFDRSNPGKMLSACLIRLPGNSDDVPVALAYRPSNKRLYLLGMQGRLYTLDTTSAEATRVSVLKADPQDSTDPFVALPATSSLKLARIGMAFEPATDRLRLFGSDGQNLLVNPDTGETTTLPPLFRQPLAVKFEVGAAAYNPVTQNFYALIDTDSSKELATINPASGEILRIATVDARARSNEGMALGFDANGRGFAALKVNTDIAATPTLVQWYQLDVLQPQNMAQQIGTFDSNLNDLTALALRP